MFIRKKYHLSVMLLLPWPVLSQEAATYDCVYNYKSVDVDNTGGPVIFVAPKGGSADVSLGPLRLNPVNVSQNSSSKGGDINAMAGDILNRLWLMTRTSFYFDSRPGGAGQGLQKLSENTGPDYASFPKSLSSGNLLVNNNCVSSSGNKNCLTVTNSYDQGIGGSVSKITLPNIQSLYLRPVPDLKTLSTWSMKYISTVVPDNEYEDHVVRFDIQGSSVSAEIRNCQGGATNCYGITTIPFSGNIGTMTCTRQATPLRLTLTPPEIDFGTVVYGSEALLRKLTWTVSGRGQAGRMTLMLDSPSRAGDVVMLGSAKIRIYDTNGNSVPLGTQLDISNITGDFTLSMEPLPGSTTNPTAELNITVTVN